MEEKMKKEFKRIEEKTYRNELTSQQQSGYTNKAWLLTEERNGQFRWIQNNQMYDPELKEKQWKESTKRKRSLLFQKKDIQEFKRKTDRVTKIKFKMKDYIIRRLLIDELLIRKYMNTPKISYQLCKNQLFLLPLTKYSRTRNSEEAGEFYLSHQWGVVSRSIQNEYEDWDDNIYETITMGKTKTDAVEFKNRLKKLLGDEFETKLVALPLVGSQPQKVHLEEEDHLLDYGKVDISLSVTDDEISSTLEESDILNTNL